MESYQKVLLEILKLSINDEKFDCGIIKKFQWEELIKEAKEHDISSLVYYTLNKKTLNNIDKNLLEAWKKDVFISNIIQKKHIEKMKNVILELKNENIKVIILKGLVLRELYPMPELRNMRDGDILVRYDDYEKAKKKLLDIGYEENNHNNIHEEFTCTGNLEIEMHNKLVNNNYIHLDFCEFEKQLWERSIKINFNGVMTNTLGKEDFLLHLIFHMAVHTKVTGFGLKQLYDLTLFIKYNSENINWKEFKCKIAKYKLLKYTEGLIRIISKLFDIDILNILEEDSDIKENDTDLLLKNILRSGVYGKKLLNNNFEKLYRNNGFMIKNLIRFILPKRQVLIDQYGDKYSYVIESSVLIPIAWIQYIIHELINKYGFINTVNHIIYSIKTANIRKNIIKTFQIPD